MSRPDDPGFLLWLLLVVPVGDLVATGFFIHLFWISRRETGRRHRSWLLGLLSASFVIITAVFCWIGFLAARRFIGLPAPENATSVTLPLIVALGVIPIGFMVVFWLSRRVSGRPPPFAKGEDPESMGDPRGDRT